MKRISVFGLGYVGAVTAACLADAGHQVTGVDVNTAKLEMLEAGRAPVLEPGLDDLIAAGRRLLQSPELWRQASANARRYYVENHAAEVVLPQFERVFRDVLERR